MGMFDKLVNKGKKMALNYAKEQLSRRTGQQRSPGGAAGYGQGAGYGAQYPSQGRQPAGRWPDSGQQAGGQVQGTEADRQAIAKYRYMLRTAPPEDMERAHAEAFARLTPQQRSMLRSELDSELPPSERPASDRPGDLARAATRGEVSRPGFMEKVLGRGSGGRAGLALGAAGGLGAGLLAGVAGGFVGSAIAGPLLEGFTGIGEGIAGAAEGLGDGAAAAGEGLGEQAGGFFDGLPGGGEGPGDWEL